jgi:dihydroneopterin aldolase
MIGSIGLEGLQIHCIVGIHPHERVDEQDLFVDICVETDFAAAAAADHVEHTIDYDRIAKELTRLAVERQFQLIETFAEEGAALLFSLFRSIGSVEMTIRKPAAVPAASCSFVHIQRDRSEG